MVEDKHRFSSEFSKFSLPVLVISFLVTFVLAFQLYPLPSFNTEIAEFAPSDSASEAADEFGIEMGNQTRQILVNVEMKDGGNVLSIESLLMQHNDYNKLLSSTPNNGTEIEGIIALSEIINLALYENDDGSNLSSVTDWNNLLERTVPEDLGISEISSNEQILAYGNFVKSAIISNDLVSDGLESWIDDRNTTMDPTPSATSTLWIIDINSDLSPEQSKSTQVELRNILNEISANSDLTYSSISMDIISYDVDESTMKSFALLILLALTVVVVVLSLAFKTITGVLFPLTGLMMALTWTYGLLSAFEVQFTALDVAVAPLVLGLGIDYSIHLQKRYEINRNKGQSTVDAWLNSVQNLALPLSLAVITTVAAFMANLLSPLPPLKSFGISLSLGVVSAFFCSTVIVGCMHVVGERVSGGKLSLASTGSLGDKLAGVMTFQKEQKAIIMIITGLLTVSSVFGAMVIKTEFDLTDFLDEEMPVMELRSDLQDSYDYSSIQMVYVLIEPLGSKYSIESGENLLDSMQYLDDTLPLTKGVVKSSDSSDRTQYNGIYTIIRDALELNPNWGENYNLKLFGDEVGKIDPNEEINLGIALKNLSQNNTVGDPLTGSTWQERVNDAALIDSDGEITKLRISIYVNSGTNIENTEIVKDLRDRIDDVSNQLARDGAVVHLTGDMVKIDTVLTGMTNSQVQSTSISLMVSFFVLMLLTRRFTPALVVIAPVGVAAFWVVGSMAALGLQWNVLTIMVSALTIGIGIDYAIHVWRRFEEEIKDSDDNWEAVSKMHSSTGLALLMSAGTTICGFAVLTLSPTPVVREFGLITSLTVFFSVILSLVVLPVLLVESNEN
ncbi:MAG: hypothetical protein CMB48_00350 [Euryarchaeota archaeon]|nr:hypothetical protein [Euryarchaeota archaeon]